MNEWGLVLNYRCALFGDGEKATQMAPPDSLTWLTITQAKGFTRNSVEKVSISKQKYAYLVLTTQV